MTHEIQMRRRENGAIFVPVRSTFSDFTLKESYFVSVFVPVIVIVNVIFRIFAEEKPQKTYPYAPINPISRFGCLYDLYSCPATSSEL